MRFASSLLLAVCAALPPALRADTPPRNVDASQQNQQFAPAPGGSDSRFSPGNADSQFPFKRDDRVQNSRFVTPGLRDKKEATVGERRAPVDVTETRQKNMIERQDYFPTPEVRDRKISPDNGEMFHAQPKGDMVRKYDLVTKYQSRITDAETAAAQRQPKMEKRTTFDKINRFVFHRNGPGDNGNPIVTKAGGGAEAAVSGGSRENGEAPPPPVAPAPSGPSPLK